MSRTTIAGVGSVSAAGAGRGALKAALAGLYPGATPMATGPRGQGPEVPVLRARPEGLSRFVAARELRRVDAFSQRMALAAFLALEDAALLGALAPERLGLVVATGYGPLGSAFGFVDDSIDKRDSLVSPLLFAGSVHTAPASSISALACVRGPVTTVTGFSHAFPEALTLALDWLESGEVDHALVVAGDELHAMLGWGAARLGGFAADGRLRALDLESCSCVPGESYAALVLGPRAASAGRPVLLEAPRRFRGRLPAGEGPIFLCARGDSTEGAGYREAVVGAGPVAAYSSLWGASPTSDAHTVLAAALALGEGVLSPVPAADRASTGLEVAVPGALTAARVRCVSVDAGGRGFETCLFSG